MLNAETKKIINSARDVLVGKIPDPKAQVEQITFAMFYKFMDEKDNEAVTLGGKRQFFTGEFENFSWSKLMDPRLGGTERMDLYTQALAKMSQNPHIAQLFRDIYKDAFIPFRSPETLSLFLKEIDQLDYTNTESLGDAFEYLLSVMGSQGDAGQFRTPRHIIDFIVDVVDPQKSDSILDPACGTAGFLISSYKHIVRQHDGKDDPDNRETPLTPDEKKDLMKNLMGYDISPDMVRLSKVNLYLHGLPNPTIYEYDTLSSEEKWDENFDVILANPPFMSPKGGIKPHKRFSIQANRAEVLFVDYIIEHLKPNGRAGIIVPEGIIFQSSNAYKDLRKKLIEDGLYCVASLPSGVFNPYAGVKTSILFFDKEICKRSKHILFVKINSDGFDLGAQRRPNINNDIPLAVEAINKYQKHVKDNGKLSIGGWPEEGENIDTYPNLQFVSKEEILGSNDYNLSFERYVVEKVRENNKWPLISLGDLFDMQNGYAFKKSDWKQEGLPIIRIANLNSETATYNYFVGKYDSRIEINNNDLLFSWSGTIGTSFGPHLWTREKGLLNQHIYKFNPKTNKINIKYAYHQIRLIVPEIESKAHGAGGLVHITKEELSNFKILVPPINIQNNIVEETENYQKIIDGAKQVIENWSPKIEINYDWKKMRLGDVCDRLTDGSHYSPAAVEVGFSYVTVKDIDKNGNVDLINSKRISKKSYDDLVKNGCKPKKGDVLFSKDGTVGKVAIVNFEDNFVVLSSLAILSPKLNIVYTEYIYYILQDSKIVSRALGMMKGMAIKRVILKDLKSLIIPIPPLEIQKQIVEGIEKEHLLVEANKKLIEIFEEKIKNVILNI